MHRKETDVWVNLFDSYPQGPLSTDLSWIVGWNDSHNLLNPTSIFKSISMKTLFHPHICNVQCSICRMGQYLSDLFICHLSCFQFKRKFIEKWRIHKQTTHRMTVKQWNPLRNETYFNSCKLYLWLSIMCMCQYEREKEGYIYVHYVPQVFECTHTVYISFSQLSPPCVLMSLCKHTHTPTHIVPTTDSHLSNNKHK